MAKKQEMEEVIITEDVQPEIPTEMRTTSVAELNKVVVLPYQEFDCVIYSGSIPIDVAASKAYYVLKSGGEFIVDKKSSDLSTWMDVILSLFDLKETLDTTIVFVKAS